MSEPVVVEAVRTPFARCGGAYRDPRPDRLLALALQGLLDRAGQRAEYIDDIITGVVTQAGEQGANMGRLASLLAEVQGPLVVGQAAK